MSRDQIEPRVKSIISQSKSIESQAKREKQEETSSENPHLHRIPMDLRAHSLIGVLMLVVTTCHHASCSSNEPSIIIKAGGGPKVESAKEQLGESESSIRLSQLETLKHSNNELSGSSDPSAITSIHRVWTASSSGSLDELSPQMISKLRRDVPFLAAYALRPRLVGGQQAVSSQLVASPSSRRLQSVMAPGGGTLVPRLGDFSEFSVDVSSKSTSEHHHRRKTSLKRKDRQQRRARKMDSFLEELKLANKRRKANGRVDALNTDGKRIKGRKNSRRLRSGRSGRKSSMSKRVQFGRQSLANGTRSDSGLKGASEATSGPDKTPFFASVRPEGKGAKSESASEPSDSNGANSIDIAEQTTRSPNETPIDADYEDNEPDAHADSQSDSESEEPEPRRVGDGDVEAEGDTVTVTPKFDGIDDDPELEPEEADEPSEGTSGVAGGGGIGATSGGGGPTSDTLGPAEDEVSSSPKHKSATGDVEPGVEFADASADGESARGGSNFGVRSKETGREDDASLDNDDDDDEEAGGTIDPQHRTGGSGGQGAAGTHSRKGSELGSDDADCRSHAHDDDGHYEHGHDHDDESNERPRRAKSHQDKIDWLRKSIPGEPGADYPILSRVNVTNFNCRDYPWPGFYADVDSDCQVSWLMVGKCTFIRSRASHSNDTRTIMIRCDDTIED